MFAAVVLKNIIGTRMHTDKQDKILGLVPILKVNRERGR